VTFLDTNVIVYANDPRDEFKQERALEVISQHLVERSGVISGQVLQEYASVALTKLKQPLAVITHQLHLLESLRVVLIEPSLVRRALEIHQLYQLSFWDAQILAAAEKAGCDALLTEDLNPGQFFVGVRCVNPFA
jgi:predicted nucleic acid-binding protein